MLLAVLAFLLIFYAGAAAMSAMAWFSAWRGAVGFSALRDLTGIADRAVLRRFFGPALADGSYRTTVAEVLRHRRRPGVILTDLPVHLLFLVALTWAVLSGSATAGLAIAAAAALHGAIVSAAALLVLAGNRQAILP